MSAPSWWVGEEVKGGAGVPISRPTSGEGFGRQLQLTSLDGLLLKVDELQPELYTGCR